MPGNMGYGLFFEPINVRLGSKPDIQREPRNVRCWDKRKSISGAWMSACS
jgi:hypothetical protein